MCTIQEFDVETVGLNGKNLIEASAGTGKTYSIAILVLRLIIEERIPIEKILMVTFTKAAVAELESRIRKFVRQGYKYSLNQEIDNASIRRIIDKAGKENCKTDLRKAVQTLDQLSVMTIHSFCEHNLMKFPFETNQSFKFDIATDISEIRDLVVNEYWRKSITTLEHDIYRHLTGTLTRGMIQEVLQKALDDKEYICDDINDIELLREISESIIKAETSRLAFEKHIRDNFEYIKRKGVTGSALTFLNGCESTDDFINKYKQGYNKGTQYIQNSFPVEYDLCDQFVNNKIYLDNLSGEYIYYSFKLAIDDLKGKVRDHKTDKNLIDFNDQIGLLHKTVVTGQANKAISSQYEAVFIDEFQDTDKLQYEIFSRLFSDKIIFYIGDPKQSIYGWRKADIETYKSAKREVDTIYSMNLNFRSTKELIEGLNSFFYIENPFADNKIGYNEVAMGLQNLGSLTNDNVACDPLEIYGFKNKTEIENFVINEINRLLMSEGIKINDCRIKPSDIAIIVRTNRESRAFKQSLSNANIPAITIDDSKVMSSEEARIIQYLMDAVIQPSRGAINRVLLNPCFGINSELIKVLDDEILLDHFREFKATWHNSGIYNTLFRFFDYFMVRKFGINLGIGGQRMLTNFYQIAEILHQAEVRNKFTPTELLNWCQRVQYETNDEYEQRVESQDDAVQITTIHRCKGLTYKIVFAPYLDLKVKEYPVFEFREHGSYKYTYQPSDEQKILWREQNEQENRRLIYVALTRAQYKIYLCINNFHGFSDSSIKNFPIHHQKEWDANENVALTDYQDKKTGSVQFMPRPKPEIEIKNTFGIHSFSALSKAHHSVLYEKTEQGEQSDYNQFIFNDLGRGANMGTALHSIFERLDYNNPGTWNQAVQEASKYYPNIIKEERLEFFSQMIAHMMNVEITCGTEQFALNVLTNGQKLTELEFCFSMDNVNKTKINEILGDEADLAGEADIEGLMTGFIDLFFEHKGKYYILDWKSNYLGNAIESYGKEGLNEAMKSSNYNLQYMIYTIAVKRWLETRIENFDYDQHFGGIIYLFLRGVRVDHESGIYTTKPDKNKIKSLEKLFKQ